MYLGWVEHFVGLCDQGYARQEAGVGAVAIQHRRRLRERPGLVQLNRRQVHV